MQTDSSVTGRGYKDESRIREVYGFFIHEIRVVPRRTAVVFRLLQDLQRVIRISAVQKITMLCISIRTISTGQELCL